MPRFVGFEKSTFDAEKYRQSARDNHGQELTSEGICAGIAKMEKYIVNGNGDWISALKDTPAYIASSDES